MTRRSEEKALREALVVVEQRPRVGNREPSAAVTLRATLADHANGTCTAAAQGDTCAAVNYANAVLDGRA